MHKLTLIFLKLNYSVLMNKPLCFMKLRNAVSTDALSFIHVDLLMSNDIISIIHY